MSFGASSFLWFLPLLGLPVFIHLFEKKRAIVHPFAATEFVLKSIEKVKKKINLKSLLLLLLRTAAVLFLILIFSDWGHQTPLLSAKREVEKDVIVVLDASASMQWQNGQGNLFEQAKQDARKLIESLPDSNRASVIVFASGVLSPDRPLSVDREQVLKVIDQAKVTFEATHPQGAFQSVTSILDKNKDELPHRPVEIHVFSDWTKAAWQHSRDLFSQIEKGREGRIKIIAHELKRDPSVPEMALENFQWSAAELPAQRFQIDIKNLMLRNAPSSSVLFSIQPLNRDPTFSEVVRSENTLAPSEVKTLPFDFRSRSSGVEIGRVSIAQKDALAFNNEHYFLVTSAKKSKVLIVDGEKDLNPFLGETFFLNKALSEGIDADARFFVVNTSPQEISQHVLSNYDVVVLANVSRLPQAKMIELRAFLEAGGGVFVTLGDQINIEEFNKGFRNIFPVALRDVVSEEKGVGLRTLSFEKETQNIFGRSLSDQDLRLLEFVKVFKYFVFETQTFGKYKSLLSLSSGSPMLLWGKLGRGQFGIWASSIDREWCDFPVQTTFLPFIQTLLQALSNSDVFIDEMDVVVGEGRVMQPSQDVKMLKMVNAANQEIAKYALDHGQGAQGVTIQSPAVPGVYWIEGLDQNGDVLTRTLFKVGVSPEETQAEVFSTSDLLELTKENALVDGEMGSASNPFLVSSEVRGASMFFSFVPVLLLSLIVLLFFESFVSAR